MIFLELIILGLELILVSREERIVMELKLSKELKLMIGELSGELRFGILEESGEVIEDRVDEEEDGEEKECVEEALRREDGGKEELGFFKDCFWPLT